MTSRGMAASLKCVVNIRLTNANANSQNSQTVKTILKKNKKEKKRAYDTRIINVNMGHSLH